MSARLRAVILGVPAMGVVAATFAAIAGGFVSRQAWYWVVAPLCIAGTVLAEKFPVNIGAEQKVNLGALPCLLAVLLLPAGAGPATATLGVLAGNVTERRSWPEAVFNAGNTLLAAAVASLVTLRNEVPTNAGVLRAGAAVFLYLCINLLVAVVPAALHGGRPYLSLARQAGSATWPALATLGACALSVAVLAVAAPSAALVPLIVLPMIYRMNRAIEAQGRANEQIAVVLRAQRRFLTDVSHQVATPLATIMTNLAILRRAERTGPAGEAIADSFAEAERMKRMLGRLRALAHADEDVPLRRELVDLAELTADVVRAYTAQASTSGVGLVTEVGFPARVNVDKDLLREAVANLVENAVRVSPRGGSVRLRVEGPTISVADHGPGIDEKQLPVLFERFQRSDSGSGLGLAIARRVVERHGGTIRVDTARGVGTTFTIELPRL